MFGTKAWRIGKILGIPISIDLSWLIIFAILTFDTASSQGRGLSAVSIALGAITSVLFFASVLAHELSHSWMAQRRGIPVLGITLFIFGGVAQIGDEPDRPSTEFLIAIMGPLMSLALALVFGGIYIWSFALLRTVPGTLTWLRPVVSISSYLALTNGLLALFNLLPGFPLDGGRVLRAILWEFTKNLLRSTRIAMLLGRGMAVLMMLYGAWTMLSDALNGIWFLLIGFFLWQASGEAYRSALVHTTLKDLYVGRLMTAPVGTVLGALPVSLFIQNYLLSRTENIYRVEENGRIVGLVDASLLRRVPRDRWASLCVRDIMLAPSSSAVNPDDSVLTVLKRLSRDEHEEVEELPVMKDGELLGVIGHVEIARYLQWKNQ